MISSLSAKVASWITELVAFTNQFLRTIAMDTREVTIKLTKPEAVVLDALLWRFSETNQLTIEDPSERQALWNLQCLFERLSDREWPTIEYSQAVLRGEIDNDTIGG
jgi:hypothetical protein